MSSELQVFDEDFIRLWGMFIVVAFLGVVAASRTRRLPKPFLGVNAVPLPQFSSWNALWRNGTDRDLIAILGLDRESFVLLKELIDEHLPAPPVSKRGRAVKLDRFAKLGLFLHFLNSTMGMKNLQQIFGCSAWMVSVVIKDYLHLVKRALLNHADARVRWPDAEQRRHLAELVSRREPTINNIIGFVDGLHLFVQCNDDTTEQSQFYNGWIGDTCINNIFVFSATGMIIFAALNFPGCVHDAYAAVQLYNLLESIDDEYAIVADVAFPTRKAMEGKIVCGSKQGAIPAARDEAIEHILKHVVMVSLRQAAEWGMRCLQGTFGRLRLRLPHDNKRRLLMMECVVLLHNFRTSRLGINQIRTVFDPHYESLRADLHYDRLARYYNIN